MATTNYSVNYEDERFQQVESEKQTALDEMNNAYNEMINQSDKYYQDQINASNQWADKQQELQNQQTDLVVNELNQQKEQTEKDYLREQKGAYTDWRKQSNQYGAEAEQMASSGLENTGFSESSQVSMYNQYQTRVATARESYSRAVLNYDNAIKEARLQNSSKLAEIAYNALQAQLELSLNGFQYKNTLLQTQLEAKRQITNDYYTRWQGVLSQINTENALAEQVRQYNEKLAEERRQYDANLAYQKERDKVKDAQWQKEYNLAKQSASSSSGGSYSSGSSSKSSGGSYTPSSSSSTSSSSTKKQTTYSEVRPKVISSAYSSLQKTYKTLYNGTSKTMGSITGKAVANKAVTDQINAMYKQGKINKNEVAQLLNKFGIK